MFENSIHRMPRPQDVVGMSTQELRDTFQITNLFVPGTITGHFTALDRLLVGGVMPTGKPIGLPNHKETGRAFFLERRELGTINIGGAGWRFRTFRRPRLRAALLPGMRRRLIRLTRHRWTILAARRRLWRGDVARRRRQGNPPCRLGLRQPRRRFPLHAIFGRRRRLHLHGKSDFMAVGSAGVQYPDLRVRGGSRSRGQTLRFCRHGRLRLRGGTRLRVGPGAGRPFDRLP